MNRRSVIRGVALGSALLSMPPFLRRAFAAEACRDPSPESIAFVATAFQEARRTGKPLLVLVIPEDTAARYARGTLFGALLNAGSSADLAVLSLAHVVCATTRELHVVCPGAEQEPLFFVVETAAVPGVVKPFNVDLPAIDRWGRGSDVDALLTERRHKLGDLLRTALVPDDATLTGRVAQVRGALPAPTVKRVESALARGLPVNDPGDAAALIYAAALKVPEASRQPLLDSLAEVTRTLLVKERIPGSKWAHSSGCGTTIEGEENQHAVKCGMGFVPEESRRFLLFLTERP